MGYTSSDGIASRHGYRSLRQWGAVITTREDTRDTGAVEWLYRLDVVSEGPMLDVHIELLDEFGARGSSARLVQDEVHEDAGGRVVRVAEVDVQALLVGLCGLLEA